MRSISVQGLGKDFARPPMLGGASGCFTALDDVSFDAEPGHIVEFWAGTGPGSRRC